MKIANKSNQFKHMLVIICRYFMYILYCFFAVTATSTTTTTTNTNTISAAGDDYYYINIITICSNGVWQC